jgi:hypothetical protein
MKKMLPVILLIAGLGSSAVSAADPQILVHPKSMIISKGGTGVFEVIAQSDEPLTYRWRRGSTSSGIGTNSTLVEWVPGQPSRSITPLIRWWIPRPNPLRSGIIGQS